MTEFATGPAQPESASPAYLHILAFFSGMCIMAVELCASRLLAPFFGTSTFVWTNIIGVIMIALSAGYVWGGKLADRKPRLGLLLRLILAACAYLIILPFAAPYALRALSSGMTGFHSSFSFLFIGSLAGITILFAAPIVLLGMTSPFLIRLLARNQRVGDSAGRIFGASTFGSVVGTFLPVLVFIPAFGTARTILLFATILLLVAAAGLIRRKSALVAPIAVLPLLLPIPPSRHTTGLIRAKESAYEYIEVYDEGTFRYLVYNDAMGFQTAANRAGIFTDLYYDYYSLLPLYMDRPASSALIVGLGGGIIANQMRYFHPSVRVDGVEIDPEVIKIAHRYFDLAGDVRVYNQDGRIFLSLGQSRYDIIIIDAYTQQIYIPFHLTTKEFFSQVGRRLSPDGLVAMNVSSAEDDSPLMVSLINTLHQAFAHVYQFRIPFTFDNILIASNRALRLDNVPPTARGGPLETMASTFARFSRERAIDGGLASLTDDRAPIERMMDWELLRRSR